MDRFGILGYTVRSNASLFAQMEKHKHGSPPASRFGRNGFFVEVAKLIWNSSDSDKERPDYEAFRYNAIRRLPLRFPMDGFWLVIRPGVKNESDNESDGDKTLVDEDEQSLYIQDEEGEEGLEQTLANGLYALEKRNEGD